MGRIADAVRSQRPARIFVDDAHLRQDLLRDLRALRDEIGAEFYVVATCWPGGREELQRSMALSGEAVRDLPLLPRKIMAELVRATGVTGPDLLIAEILDQAQGRPGLAVTLALLSLQRGTEDLATGDFLFHDVVSGLRTLVGGRVVPVLGAFAAGGRAGMQMNVVAQCLGMPVAEVWELTTQVAAGGLLRESAGETLAVEPAALRDALVRSVFFAGARSLPIRSLLDAAPDRASAAVALARVRQRGGDVPHRLIQDQLEQCIPSGGWSRDEHRRAWVTYAFCGPEAVEWVLDHHADLLGLIAWAGLTHSPSRTIRLLLEKAVGDARELPGQPEHPLRILQDWVKAGRPGTAAALARREAVLDALLQWMRDGSINPVVARRTLPIVLTPEYELTGDDPISHDVFTIQSSHLTAAEFHALVARWPDALEILRTVGLDGTRELDHTVRMWAFPGMLRGDVSDDVAEAAQAGAQRMLEDVATLGQEHPGIIAWAVCLAERAGLAAAIPRDLDPDFRVLFPKENYEGDHTARLRRQHAAADELAERWSAEDARTVAGRLANYDREGALSGHRWPWLTDVVAEGIAGRVDDPVDWIDALAENDARPQLIEPFLRKVMGAPRGSSETVWQRLFSITAYQRLCLFSALRAPAPPEAVLGEVMAHISEAPELVETACLRGEVPEEIVHRLLRHDSGPVAAAAAEGVWGAGERGEIPPNLFQSWRAAVVQHVGSEHVLQAVFVAYPTIARDWLLARAEGDVPLWSRHDDAFEKAASALDRASRRDLLGRLRASASPSGLFGMLVGEDPELFRLLLRRPDLESVHLEPLYGQPTPGWARLSVVALEEGYSPDELASAPHGGGWSWTGRLSTMWQEWADSFAGLEQHEDARIREIGRIGRERAERQRESETERERNEDVFGRGR
jgi:hypothetical protein